MYLIAVLLGLVEAVVVAVFFLGFQELESLPTRLTYLVLGAIAFWQLGGLSGRIFRGVPLRQALRQSFID